MTFKFKGKKYNWNVKKFLCNALFAVSMFFIAWFVISYIDIITHNLSGGTNWKWNLLVLLLG